MKQNITRRDFLKVAGGGCLAAATGTLGTPFINQAFAAQKLSVVEWGAPYIGLSQKVGKKWGKADIIWTLHSGGAAGILPKIKTAWPNPPYDIVDVWSPVFMPMIREGWAEKVTLDDCPNLKDIPETFITKDENGNWMNIPRGTGGVFWASVPENCPIEITNIEDLLNPKLKGQILWPNPTLETNLQVMSLALARGGSPDNLEPGWQFLKELAKSGNIGRVAANTSDIITSFDTGETSVTFTDQGSINGVKGVKVKYLTKTHETLKTFMYVSGWVVLKSSKNKKLAFDFANATISKENSELHFKEVGERPAHLKAKHTLEHLRFSGEEVEKYVVVPDWGSLSKKLDGWNKYFEKEIVPLT